ncbi:hypothetical protein ACI76O_08725 [Capnocytophaga cynodegmi]|uniref:hypothetical protein n=1 Tax=Capnocytophaga cynodegmi TaxID=28189 RepID=UPI00385A7F11
MKADKKIELYQYYKKLESKLINKNIVTLLLRGISIFIWFVMFCSGVNLIYVNDTNWYDLNSFKKEICRLDSIDFNNGRSSATNYLMRIQDTSLPIEKRKQKIVYMDGKFNFSEYLGIEESVFISAEIGDKIYDSIPLWVNKNSGIAYPIQKHSPDKIDFTTDKILFVIFLLSFPFYYFFIIVLWKKWKKQKIKLQREIIKAKLQWQNYTE